MDIIAKLNNLQNERTFTHTTCSFIKIFDKLNAEEIDTLKKVLDDPTIRHTDLAKTLYEVGFNISYVTVARHRRRLTGAGCKCPE